MPFDFRNYRFDVEHTVLIPHLFADNPAEFWRQAILAMRDMRKRLEPIGTVVDCQPHPDGSGDYQATIDVTARCKGSIELGNGCGSCPKCKQEIARLVEEVKASRELRGAVVRALWNGEIPALICKLE